MRRIDWGALLLLALPLCMVLLALVFEPPAPEAERLIPVSARAAGMVVLADGGLAVDLNAADAALLQALPGIGPALAGRILELRAEKGGFESIEELLQVKGIGPATLDGLRARAAVASPPDA